MKAKRYFIFILILLWSSFVFGQTSNLKEDCKTVFDSVSKRTIYYYVDVMPEFPGGTDSLFKFISENLKWPDNGQADVVGIVFISFIVETDGSLTNIRVIRGIYAGADKEALNVIEQMPNWTSGKCKGKLVPVIINIPIKFVMQ